MVDSHPYIRVPDSPQRLILYWRDRIEHTVNHREPLRRLHNDGDAEISVCSCDSGSTGDGQR